MGEIITLLKQILEEQRRNEKVTLTINECAEISGIGRDTLTMLIKKPNTDFPFFKVGNKTLINKALFIVWLDNITKQNKKII